jgi:Cytosine deaminase and related metal-dependent hydrolases
VEHAPVQGGHASAYALIGSAHLGRSALIKNNQLTEIQTSHIPHTKYELPSARVDNSLKKEYTQLYMKNSPTNLINTHCHVPMTLLRGIGDGLTLQQWLFNEILPREAKLTPEDIYRGAVEGIKEMQSHGVASFSDMYFCCDEIIRACRDTGMKANIAHGITSLDDLPKTEELFRKFGHKTPDDNIKIDVALHAEYTSNREIAEETARLAKKYGAIIQVHLSETKQEHEDCIKRHGMTPAEYFADTGIFNNPTIAAHAVWVTDSDIKLLAEYNVSVAHCPTSNLRLGCGIAPIMKMLAAGVNVTIGTDGAASCDTLDIWHEAHLAALLQRGINQDPTLLPEAELLKMCTTNGLIAQGRTKI